MARRRWNAVGGIFEETELEEGKGWKREYYGTPRHIFYENSLREYHREDGPAIIHEGEYEAYYLDGKEYTREEWQEEMWNRNVEKVLK